MKSISASKLRLRFVLSGPALWLLLIAAVSAPARVRPPLGSLQTPQGEQEPVTTQVLLDQAYALLRDGKLDEATASFQRVLERDPTNRTACLELAYLYGRMGKWADASRQFESVVRVEPENLRLRLDLAYALQKAGETAKAAEQFLFVAARPGELQAQAHAELEVVQAQQRDANLARRDALLNRGYARLRAGDRIGARHEFEQALNADPANATVLKQIGYLALEEGNLALAAQNFEAARVVDPQDATLALQLGYLYDRIGQPEKAAGAFEAAAGSSEARTQQLASAALRALRASQLARVYLDLYATPSFATRFDNFIVQFQGQLHWRPRPSWPVTLYLGTRITHDSKSRGGSLPAIFSDNVALVGAGVSFRPKRTNLALVAEANLAFNLTTSTARNRDVEPDYRAALYYYRRWEGKLYGPAGALTLGRLRSDRLFTDLDASLGYYSRYDHNGIGYLQLREGVRLADWRASRLYGYAKINLVKDTNRDFYNNLAEFGPGVEFRPSGNFNLSLRAEYLRGTYFGIEGHDPNPFRAQYNDFRMTLLVGHRFRIR